MCASKVPDEVMSFVTTHSNGNPLHIIELCRHLIAEQLLYVLNGECQFSNEEARRGIRDSRVRLRKPLMTYPRVLIQNARSRLDRLSPTEQVRFSVMCVDVLAHSGFLVGC